MPMDCIYIAHIHGAHTEFVCTCGKSKMKYDDERRKKPRWRPTECARKIFNMKLKGKK